MTGDRTGAHIQRRFPELNVDWVLAAVMVIGLIVMLTAIGPGSSDEGKSDGAHLAVGRTATDAAIMIRLSPCGSETVRSISLEAVEAGLILWQASAVEPESQYVFVVGQPPTTFVETVPMLEQLPRGALLEASVEAGATYTAQFYFADLLPDLWSYEGTYYPTGDIEQIMEESIACSRASGSSSTRTLVVLGFLAAAAAGAGLVSRRIVSSDL